MPALPTALTSFITANAGTLAAAGLSAGASLYGASQQRKSASEAMRAAERAGTQQMGLERQLYEQQRADLEPWRQVGLGALQQLSQLYGIQVPQGTFGGAAAAQRQMQQPMQGPGAAYLARNPDLQQEFAKPGVREMFQGDPEAYANWHYANFGMAEGREGPGAITVGQEAPDVQQPAQFEGRIAGQPGETAFARTGEVSMAPEQGQALQLEPPQAAEPVQSAQPAQPARMPANAFQGADQRFANFFTSPDYQFRLQQGTQNVLAARAALGGLESGAAMRELQNVGQQEASAEYANYFNRLSQLAGYGPSATSQIGAAGQNYAAGAGIISQNLANLRGQTSYAQRGGTAQAVGDIAGSLSDIFSQSQAGRGQREMFNPATATQRGYSGANVAYGPSFASFQPPRRAP